MSNSNFESKTVGEIVTNDFRTAGVFKRVGIDFCCGGSQGILEACNERGINIQELENELDEVLLLPISPTLNYKDWEPGFLMDYIQNTHHKYVQKTLPDLLFYTQKIANVHGEHHPELVEVADLFQKIHDELVLHLKREEEVFFPWVREMIGNPTEKAKQKVREEIEGLHGEHDFAGGAMDDINKITKGYEVPADGCNTYKIAFKLLEQFEDDLHTHVHLENNILFRKALQLT